MSIFHRVWLRFVAEGVAIVLAAIIAGVEHLAWWEVGAAVGAVLVAAIVLESVLSQPTAARPVPAPAAVLPPIEPTPHVRVLQEKPLSELMRAAEPLRAPEPAAPEPAPEPEPDPEPEPAPVAVAAPSAPLAGPPWNVWELERAHRDSGSTDDEKSFLLHYLRDYAGPDGALPAEFDDLVRESFGSLL